MKRLASLCLSLLMILILLPVLPAQNAAAADYSEDSVRAAMLALESRYPEGTPFGNNSFYAWHGGIFSGGYGCAGFAFMLSDAAFGSLPARKYYDYSQIRVGDILRINNDGHSVIVLYVNANSVTVAEGNFNGKVHWRREIPMSTIKSKETVYAMTRYPETQQTTTPQPQARGDLNGDSGISAEDAQIVLVAYVQAIAGQAHGLSQAQIRCADVDSNGSVDVADAQYILLYYAENILAGRNYAWDYIISRK